MAMRANILIGALAIGLAGCSSDPASEPPVELKGGLYQVSAHGGTVVELKGADKRSAEICFAPESASALPGEPLAHLIPSWDGCDTHNDPPRGNAMSGSRNCPGGEGHERHQSMHLAFTGRHTADTFDIAGAVTQGDDEGNGVMHLGSGDFAISGKRVGDC